MTRAPHPPGRSACHVAKSGSAQLSQSSAHQHRRSSPHSLRWTTRPAWSRSTRTLRPSRARRLGYDPPVIITQGRGWIIVLVTFACLLASELAIEGITGDDRYYQHHGWTKLVAFLAASALVSALIHVGVFAGERRVLIDKATGAEVVDEARHTLFFVPARHWPLLLIGLGALATLVTTD